MNPLEGLAHYLDRLERRLRLFTWARGAAAVAAATIGFAGDMHMPKGMIFTMGMLSMMFASGTSSVITILVGRTTSELGAIPMVHIMVAPMQTCIGIRDPPASWLQGILAKPRANATR